MTRGLRLALAFIFVCPAWTWALDPAKHLTQYAHAAWRTKDGFFTGIPHTLTQTEDGYIWVGGSFGLVRFDGVRFVPWGSDHSEQLPSGGVNYLLAARDGSLWIGTTAGVRRWKNQTLAVYTSRGPATGGPFLEDRQGTVWFLMPADADESTLCKAEPTGIRCLGRQDGLPVLHAAYGLTDDASGNLWIGDATRLLRWSKTSSVSYQTPGLANNSTSIPMISGVVARGDGTIWVGMWRTGRDFGLQKFVNGQWRPFKARDFDGSALDVTTLAEDREGSLWVGTSSHGIYRIYNDTVDHFDTTSGLSDDRVWQFIEDREGSVWVATDQGVDRFNDVPLTSFGNRDGICGAEIDSVVAAADGGVWIGASGGVTHLRNGIATCLRSDQELPGNQVTSLLEDDAGRLWIGIDNMLGIYERGTFRRITRPDGSPIGFVSGIAQDAAHRIWVAAVGPSRTLLCIDNLVVKAEYREPALPRRMALSSSGDLWVGTVRGDLALLHDGKVTVHAFDHDDSAVLNQLLPARDGSILAATSFGLIGWHEGRRLQLTAKNGLPCDAVNAITYDAGNNLWLYMDCALGMMANADLETWKRNPDRPVAIRTYDALDGVRPGRAPFNAGATSQDGRVWFANQAAVQMLDPSRVRRNPIPPPVHIEQIRADRRAYPVAGIVNLPPLTRDLEIDYVGLSFVAPQKVLFRYRLEGRDQTWQEPGTRRQAFYNDLRPGTYHFRVIARNNDGLWNEQGAAVDIVIAPAWYQTRAFGWLSFLTALAALWVVYQLRMRQVARALNVRFDERLAERTRVARDLHDTLLQTVQGSKMVADTALSRPDDTTGLRDAMERVSAWLGQASTEGRAAVNALRVSTTETNDLAEAFRRAIADCRRQGLVEAAVSVTGTARELHPVVRDEVFRIGYEAIRNACSHSGASRLEVGLTYDRDLIVRVVDNGVGMDAALVDDGKLGHFGLQGMRERAERIGAKLTISGHAGSGTTVVLTVPGRAIFRA